MTNHFKTVFIQGLRRLSLQSHIGLQSYLVDMYEDFITKSSLETQEKWIIVPF